MPLSKVCAPLALILSLAIFTNAHADEKKFQRYFAARATLEHADANQFIFDNGFGEVIALGANYRNHLRGEISLSRRESDITGVPPIETTGYFRAWAMLVNLYYHPLGIDNRISPYLSIGGGFNHAAVQATATSATYAGMGFPEQDYFEESYQAKVGVAVRVLKGVYVDIEGAYFVSNDHDIDVNFPNKSSIEASYRTYSGLAGLRIEF